MLEIDVDGHGLEVQETVVLNQRPDDLSATVVTLCGACAFRITVNNQNLIGRCKFVSSGCKVHSSNENQDKEPETNDDNST